eukprot:TRINITY_DN23058_c0_g1_i4.p1 TRINITY_DN23058_c0_g1~~TRINITY_DN23058_c0_g1_i4.p1  ORF type:complete len:426 (+),score=78.96 TRINITY_DN23058_c0_g1_i4:267-1544(+)
MELQWKQGNLGDSRMQASLASPLRGTCGAVGGGYHGVGMPTRIAAQPFDMGKGRSSTTAVDGHRLRAFMLDQSPRDLSDDEALMAIMGGEASPGYGAQGSIDSIDDAMLRALMAEDREGCGLGLGRVEEHDDARVAWSKGLIKLLKEGREAWLPPSMKEDSRPPAASKEDSFKMGNACVGASAGPHWFPGYQSLSSRAYASEHSVMREVLQDDSCGIRCCAQRGLDINALLPNGGGPPLVEAAGRGNVAMARTLIELKADVSKANLAGFTPLMAAVRCPSEAGVETVELLLEHLPAKALLDCTKERETALSLVEKELEKAKDEQRSAGGFLQAALRSGGMVSSTAIPDAKAWLELKQQCKDAHQRVVLLEKITDMVKTACRAATLQDNEETSSLPKAVKVETISEGTQARGSGRWWLHMVEPQPA